MNKFKILFLSLLCFASQLLSCDLLWEGEKVSLVHDEGRIAVVVNSGATIANVSEEEIVALETTVAKMQRVFQDALGFGDFARWMPLGHEELKSYLYPAAAHTFPDEINAYYKARLTIECLSNKPFLPSLTQEQIDRISAVAATVLPYSQPPIALEERAYTVAQIHESYELLKAEIEERGGECDAVWQELPTVVERLQSSKCVAFCNPSVIQRQLVVESPFSYVLTNNKPYTAFHFMVVPKCHKATLLESLECEIVDKYHLFARLDSILRNRFSSKHVGVMTRIGARAGQTQFHLHDHVLSYQPDAVQAWMIHWTQEVCRMPYQPPKLTDQQLEAIRNDWQPLFGRVKAVAFDFGGVIVQQKKLEKDFLREEFSVTDDQLQLLWPDVMRVNSGEVDEEAFWKEVAKKLNTHLRGDFPSRWRSCYVESNPPYPQMLSLLDKLQAQGIATPLLSNTIPSHAEMNQARGLYDYFAPLLLSFEIRTAKPSQEAYQKLIDATGVAPHEIVFVDDLQENVNAAHFAGMHSILFKTPEQVEREIQQLIPGF